MKTVRESSTYRDFAMNEAIVTHRRWKSSGLLFALLFGTAFGAGAACTFRTNPGGIAFGTFDPSVGSTRTAATTARVRCSVGQSPTWQFTGANGSAPLQMRHATASVFIPYTIAASYVSGGVGNQVWNITATVLGPNYQNAQVGSYSDLLTLTITP